MLVNFLKNLFGNEPVNNQKITNAKRVLVTVFLPLQKSQKIVFFYVNYNFVRASGEKNSQRALLELDD